jgi:hypothetical protein
VGGRGQSYNPTALYALPTNVVRNQSLARVLYAGQTVGASSPVLISIYDRTGHALMLFRYSSSTVMQSQFNFPTVRGVVSADEMSEIDLKLDDGLPLTGRLIGGGNTACAGSGNFYMGASSTNAYNFITGRSEESCAMAYFLDEDQ